VIITVFSMRKCDPDRRWWGGLQ